MQLRGRTALVTGAGRRVGRALAVALGGRGMRVAVHYHAAKEGAAETLRAIQSAGGSGARGAIISAVHKSCRIPSPQRPSREP